MIPILWLLRPAVRPRDRIKYTQGPKVLAWMKRGSRKDLSSLLSLYILLIILLTLFLLPLSSSFFILHSSIMEYFVFRYIIEFSFHLS